MAAIFIVPMVIPPTRVDSLPVLLPLPHPCIREHLMDLLFRTSRNFSPSPQRPFCRRKCNPNSQFPFSWILSQKCYYSTFSHKDRKMIMAGKRSSVNTFSEALVSRLLKSLPLLASHGASHGANMCNDCYLTVSKYFNAFL